MRLLFAPSISISFEFLRLTKIVFSGLRKISRIETPLSVPDKSG